MQDINNNISHRDMKPFLVDPSPLLKTTFPVVSYDNNNVNTSRRAGNDTDLDVLGQYINHQKVKYVYSKLENSPINLAVHV